jgi:PIN domain nuclease of toxin-antitoxin system
MRSIASRETPEDLPHVIPDCALADAEDQSDLAIRSAARDDTKYFQLSLGDWACLDVPPGRGVGISATGA